LAADPDHGDPAAEQQFTGSDGAEAGDEFEQGRFAAAAGADQRDEIAGSGGEAEGIEDRRSVAVVFPDRAKLDGGRRRGNEFGSGGRHAKYETRRLRESQREVKIELDPVVFWDARAPQKVSPMGDTGFDGNVVLTEGGGRGGWGGGVGHKDATALLPNLTGRPHVPARAA
jgi:hypothetical protein